MTYKIIISSVAEAETDKIFLSISQRLSPERAREWYKGLLKAIKSLEKMPKRCPLARENQYFSQEIRQLLYGKGRNTYRIIFTVIENQDSSFVRILHVRHAVQRSLYEE
ncbi:type II toxin-antitoxin system RelE/ParE family toxin [Crocosphaera sp.]|uniref:type II toxin-antitoxin system RelE/ParE family toxin n=1 Tax=Crocosphaera sp. TaxID=2729996 RepID=UPI003F1E808F|nr:type II toxin-antitoxin system RelE/ParE family toxin [Crocosphaera sp.]